MWFIFSNVLVFETCFFDFYPRMSQNPSHRYIRSSFTPVPAHRIHKMTRWNVEQCSGSQLTRVATMRISEFPTRGWKTRLISILGTFRLGSGIARAQCASNLSMKYFWLVVSSFFFITWSWSCHQYANCLPLTLMASPFLKENISRIINL